MKYRRMLLKECRMCGKVFETGRANKYYCSPECSYEKRQELVREYQEREAGKKAVQGKMECAGPSGLARLNERARSAGMSYGKYQLEQQLGRAADGQG